MTRSELCARVAARSSLSNADVAAALGALTSTIANALAEGETVTIAGFGKFTARTRAGRQGRNPRTSEPVAVPAARVPSFKVARRFATDSTHSGPSPVDSYPALAPVPRTRHASAFGTAPRRHATAGRRARPGCSHPAPSNAAAGGLADKSRRVHVLARRLGFQLATRDRVTFVAVMIVGHSGTPKSNGRIDSAR
jgi:DNA-binding protein HU-beta